MSAIPHLLSSSVFKTIKSSLSLSKTKTTELQVSKCVWVAITYSIPLSDLKLAKVVSARAYYNKGIYTIFITKQYTESSRNEQKSNCAYSDMKKMKTGELEQAYCNKGVITI